MGKVSVHLTGAQLNGEVITSINTDGLNDCPCLTYFTRIGAQKAVRRIKRVSRGRSPGEAFNGTTPAHCGCVGARGGL